MTSLLSNLGRTPVLLAILAVGLYLPGFGWGAPHATSADRVQSWGVDDGTPLQPLADVHNIYRPQADRNLGYPLMHSLLMTAAYAPYLGWLWLTGQFHPGAGTGYPFGLADPVGALRNLTLIAHLVSVLMGAGIALAAYDAASALWERRAGVLAAFFTMSSFPMFYYSRTGNPDVPALFFTALALAAYARSIASGLTPQRAVWMGVFAGLAVATKEPSFASFLALPFVLFYLQWRPSASLRTSDHKSSAGWLSWEFLKAPVVAGVAVFLAFGLCSGLFVDPKFYLAHVEFARSRVQTLTSAELSFVRSYPHTLAGNIELARVLAGYLADALTLPGFLLSLVGVAWSFRRQARVMLFALPALTYLLVLFWGARAGQLRYVLPPVFTLAVFAAGAVIHAWDSSRELGKAAGRILRFSFAAVAVFVLALALLRGADLTHAMRNDSRYAAAEWLAPRTPPGTRIEYFGESGELPPLKSEVITTRAIAYFGAAHRPRLDSAAVEEIRRGWQERKPDMIILLPDHSSAPGAPYNITCPPQIYQGLLDGSLGYRLAALFETPRLVPWARRPALDYPSVNPPIRIFVRSDAASSRQAGRPSQSCLRACTGWKARATRGARG